MDPTRENRVSSTKEKGFLIPSTIRESHDRSLFVYQLYFHETFNVWGIGSHFYGNDIGVLRGRMDLL